MMLSKRETVLIIVLMVTLAALGYYVFYFGPAMERINLTSGLLLEKENEAAAAELRELQYAQLLFKQAETSPEAERYAREIPVLFDGAEILYRIQDIFYEFTTAVNISFPENIIVSETTAIHTVALQFTVTLDDFLKILQKFSDEKTYNRIVYYSLSRADNALSNNPLQRVVMQVDYLVAYP